MAKEDFCFNFYDGDAARDASHMNRTERGGYYDMIMAQRKFGWLTIDHVKKVLGKDFDEIWPAIELIMIKDGDFFYIEWVETSLQKMRTHSGHQSENGKKGGRPPKNKPTEKPNESQLKANDNPNESQKKPLGNGYGNVLGLKEEGMGETNEGALVPEMVKQFQELNPDYPSDQLLDFPAAKLLAQKIHKWDKLPGKFTDPSNRGTLMLRWGEISEYVRNDPFMCGYSITQINKHFQSVIQSIVNRKNGTHQQPVTGKEGKPGTSVARTEALKNWTLGGGG
jgi:hypothetical protein